jgi:tetratricopeptide (TPR) repeat protein
VGYIDRELSLRRIHESNKSLNSIQQKAGTLKILKKILREFPDTWEIVGRQRVKERLFYLTYYLATLCFQSGRYREAVKYFLKALITDRIKFIFMPLNLFISGKNNALRYYKRKIIKRS